MCGAAHTLVAGFSRASHQSPVKAAFAPRGAVLANRRPPMALFGIGFRAIGISRETKKWIF
jgi:hypothetical protein